MKKILMLSVLVLGVSVAAPAFAEKGGMQGEHHGKRGGMFKKVDTDGNGEISRAEFDAKHDAMFKKMDKDANGSISKDEMKGHHEARKAKHEERMEKRKEKRENRSED